MNAPHRIFVNPNGGQKAARLLGAAAVASILAGCVNIASTKIDPHSPIAPEVAKLSRADRDYPSFNEIPAKPNDVEPPRIYGERARQLEMARNQVDAATAPSTWTLSNSETFAGKARHDAGPDFSTPAPTDTEAFAREGRKRATPPPPVKH
jgi:hypothetical protein